MDVVIITGMSGAGKKTTAHLLEDMGYYCVDNMPVSLMSSFFEIYEKNPDKNTLVSFTLDVRVGEDIRKLIDTADQIRNTAHHSCKIIFLDATDDVLIKRYKESRHIHPLLRGMNVSLESALEAEREIVSPIEGYADFVIDTSNLRPTELKNRLGEILRAPSKDELAVSCISFGYKYGIPHDLDLMFDVRCFPNPFYIPELKKHTGLEKCVSEFVFAHDETREFLTKLYDMVDYLIPLYIKEGKAHLSIGIGCTGGRHRSVAIAQALSAHLSEKPEVYSMTVHRDIKK